MTEKTKKAKTANDSSVMSWEDFLQDHPPGGPVEVSKCVQLCLEMNSPPYTGVSTPQLNIHCPGPKCNRKMFFTCADRPVGIKPGETKEIFLKYTCRNCWQYSKIFAVSVRRSKEGEGVEVYKFGEYPPFGPPVPSRVLRLVQSDHALFMKGRQCENQGLGIGAFTYYRRVVEGQWTRLIDEILKVVEAVNAPKEIFDSLNAAKGQQQLSKAIKEIQPGIPAVLLINGHNPLFLLHSALSQGLHNFSDEDCLDLAKKIRIVLVEFAEKLDHALKDEKELKDAINRLSQVHAEKKKKQGDETEADQ